MTKKETTYGPQGQVPAVTKLLVTGKCRENPAGVGLEEEFPANWEGIPASWNRATRGSTGKCRKRTLFDLLGLGMAWKGLGRGRLVAWMLPSPSYLGMFFA